MAETTKTVSEALLPALVNAIREEGYEIVFDLQFVRLIKMQEVKSSNISSIGYDYLGKLLFVRFIGSGTYRYEDCSKEEFDNLLKAESKGSYFAKSIKPTKKCSKL